MFRTSSLRYIAAAFCAAMAVSFAAVPSAFAVKKAVVGAVSFDVPDDFKEVAGKIPSLHEDASGITVEVSDLPPEALHEFKGPAFLEFLASLGYTNATYAAGVLKRTDAHTYVLADAKEAQGPEFEVPAGPGRQRPCGDRHRLRAQKRDRQRAREPRRHRGYFIERRDRPCGRREALRAPVFALVRSQWRLDSPIRCLA